MRKLPLIIVEWQDTSGTSRWENEKGASETEPINCITVGWKLKSTPKKLILIGSRTDSGDCIDRTTLPRSAIKSIRRLE